MQPLFCSFSSPTREARQSLNAQIKRAERTGVGLLWRQQPWLPHRIVGIALLHSRQQHLTVGIHVTPAENNLTWQCKNVTISKVIPHRRQTLSQLAEALKSLPRPHAPEQGCRHLSSALAETVSLAVGTPSLILQASAPHQARLDATSIMLPRHYHALASLAETLTGHSYRPSCPAFWE